MITESDYNLQTTVETLDYTPHINYTFGENYLGGFAYVTNLDFPIISSDINQISKLKTTEIKPSSSGHSKARVILEIDDTYIPSLKLKGNIHEISDILLVREDKLIKINKGHTEINYPYISYGDTLLILPKGVIDHIDPDRILRIVRRGKYMNKSFAKTADEMAKLIYSNIDLRDITPESGILIFPIGYTENEEITEVKSTATVRTEFPVKVAYPPVELTSGHHFESLILNINMANVINTALVQRNARLRDEKVTENDYDKYMYELLENIISVFEKLYGSESAIAYEVDNQVRETRINRLNEELSKFNVLITSYEYGEEAMKITFRLDNDIVGFLRDLFDQKSNRVA